MIGNLRRGLTLIELLVVVLIASILAAIVLPTFKTVVTEQKTTQASIQLRSIFDAARTKAQSKGRNVAVVLERMDDTEDLDVGTYDAVFAKRNSILRVSLAEVMAPYRGDTTNSTVTINATAMQNEAVFDPMRDVSWSNYAIEGNLIAFDDRPEFFEITDVNLSNNTILFANQPESGISQTEMPHRPFVQLLTRNSTGTGYVARASKFRILSRPRRLFDKPIELPRGTCIDLSLSGMVNAPFTDDPAQRYGLDSTSFSSQRLHMAGDASVASSSIEPRYFKPVFIVFSPTGAVTEVYHNTIGTNNGGQWSPITTRYLTTGFIYLMVGRTGQVHSNPNSLPSDTPSNLRDQTAFWLRISPTTGQVAIASNAGGNSIMESRSLSMNGIDRGSQ